MDLQDRYKRNYPSIDEKEQEILKNSVVCVVGCGGLGGYIIESLARIGIGTIKCVDADSFSSSNLNRQILSTEKNLEKSKAKEAKKRIKSINSNVKVKCYEEFFSKDNALKILKGSSIVIDALDNIEARLILEKACEELGLCLVHGAIQGWRLQAAVIRPGDKLFEKIYQANANIKPPSVLSFTPAVAANIEVSEAIKLLLNKEDILFNKLLIYDLSCNSFNVIELS